MTYLQLHHNIVELVVPSAANEFTDVVFTWTREENELHERIKEVIDKLHMKKTTTIKLETRIKAKISSNRTEIGSSTCSYFDTHTHTLKPINTRKGPQQLVAHW